jgi:2-C-methyl-D-erythritol 2,4-cyclodiphosphate synthase
LKLRTGIGYDIHRLEKGRRLVLGGIEISFPKGLAGHSDGDVLIHAIIDALLGAMGERDIGQRFPDTEPAYRNIRSTELLVSVIELLKQANYAIVNIDSVIIAQTPILNPHIPEMKNALCPLLGLRPNELGIKAKTKEGLGEIGHSRAIAAWAAAMLELKPQ